MRFLSAMGGHEPTQAGKDNYIPQRCARHDPVQDEDPKREFAPNINIGLVDPEHEQYIRQRIIVRSHAATKEFREEAHYRG